MSMDFNGNDQNGEDLNQNTFILLMRILPGKEVQMKTPMGLFDSISPKTGTLGP